MQGITPFIPTSVKIEYINQLLKVGFHTIDFGSFVSPKAIPQMADTAKVLEGLKFKGSRTRLLAIVANQRGAEDASQHGPISYLGFPLSISETFQKRNTNHSIAEALNTLEEIKNICVRSGKELVTYISMGFGNPYGDPYEPEIVSQFVNILVTLGSDVISLADTVGTAESAQIESLFASVSKQVPGALVGVHLHSSPHSARNKIEAALRGGCRRLDGALRGFGGCPMAADELVGNVPTETIISVAEERQLNIEIDKAALQAALLMSSAVFARV